MNEERVEDPKLQKLELDADRHVYLASMCGQQDPEREKRRKERSKADQDAGDGLSAYVLSRMPAERQVEAVVRHFGVISYSRQLRKKLPPNTLRTNGTDARLFELLRRCAVLVCGNWVLKSELAGFAEAEAGARDMLLCLFEKKQGRLTQTDFDKWGQAFMHSTSRPTREEISRSLVAVEQGDRNAGFKRLKNPLDIDFVKRFPEDVKENGEWWDKRRLEIVKSLSGWQAGAAAAAGAGAQASAARLRARLLGEVRAVLAVGSTTLAELRRTLQNKNQQQLIKEEDLQKILRDPELDAMQLRDLWTLARTGNQAQDDFRKVLFTLFRSRDTVTKLEVMVEYERIHGVKCELSEYQQRGLIKELAERADGDNYVLKGAFGGTS